MTSAMDDYGTTPSNVKAEVNYKIQYRWLKRAVSRFVPIHVKRMLRAHFSQDTIPIGEGRRAFLFLAADYGNIGDLAITASQLEFLKQHSGADIIIPIPISKTANLIRFIRRNVSPDDLITIVGGGNMGVLYPDIERLRQWVIKSFPNNRIVCFPQTLDWKNDRLSVKALKKICKIYSQHPDIHVFARETVTYEKLQSMFNDHPSVQIGYSPDIVLSGDSQSFGTLPRTSATGILQALRSDREQVLNKQQQEYVLSELKKTGLEVSITDTHVGGTSLEASEAERLLTGKVAQFCSCKLVVTDRLHGMILAAISGVPCIVLPSASHKLYHTWYDWLADVPRVRFLGLDDLGSFHKIAVEMILLGRVDIERKIIDGQSFCSLVKSVSKF